MSFLFQFLRQVSTDLAAALKDPDPNRSAVAQRLLAGFSVISLGIVFVGYLAVISVAAQLFQESQQSLAQMALHADEPAVRLEATKSLLALGSVAAAETQRIASQTSDPDVLAYTIRSLGSTYDYSVIETCFAALSHDSAAVQHAAARGLVDLLGRDHHFPFAGTAAEREACEQRMRADWAALQDSELFHYNTTRLKQQ